MHGDAEKDGEPLCNTVTVEPSQPRSGTAGTMGASQQQLQPHQNESANQNTGGVPRLQTPLITVREATVDLYPEPPLSGLRQHDNAHLSARSLLPVAEFEPGDGGLIAFPAGDGIEIRNPEDGGNDDDDDQGEERCPF